MDVLAAETPPYPLLPVWASEIGACVTVQRTTPATASIAPELVTTGHDVSNCHTRLGTGFNDSLPWSDHPPRCPRFLRGEYTIAGQWNATLGRVRLDFSGSSRRTREAPTAGSWEVQLGGTRWPRGGEVDRRWSCLGSFGVLPSQAASGRCLDEPHPSIGVARAGTHPPPLATEVWRRTLAPSLIALTITSAAAGHQPASSTSSGNSSTGPSTAASWARAIALPAVIVLLCLHSLSAPGYVLQVDSAFGPRSPAINWGFSAPIQLIAHLLGGSLAGRFWLAGSLFLCGFGPMVFLRDRPWAAQLFAGALASLNPWVFGRLVEGQWGVVAALGAVFLWLGAWEALQRQPGWRLAFECAVLGWLAATLDQHALGLLVVLAGASLLWRKSWRSASFLRWGATSVGLLGALLVYGWVPFFVGHNLASYSSVKGFTQADLTLFRASASPSYGLWVNLMGLFGFWPERLGRIPLLNQGAPWWPVTTAVLAVTALTGAWLRRDRAWLLPAGVLGLLLAGSTATGPGLAAMVWLMRRLPLLGAFREPEKWSALWLIALVVLGAETLTFLAAKASVGRASKSAISGVVIAGIGLAVLLPGGVDAIRELPVTVVPVSYPATWLRTAAYMKAHVPSSSPVVVLPWELYEPLAFIGHHLATNPAPVVFPGRLLSSQDAQIAGAQNALGPDGIARASLHAMAGSCALQSSLARIGAQWVLVEPAPHGSEDARELLACGFTVRSGRPPGPVLLHR